MYLGGTPTLIYNIIGGYAVCTYIHMYEQVCTPEPRRMYHHRMRCSHILISLLLQGNFLLLHFDKPGEQLDKTTYGSNRVHPAHHLD